ncbi:hypothetical protein [Pseudorhodoplanes sp.]|uniref:hypothetical protein n=1 Tax=Pseudorhodoplanes sp. TaxID=1934341 RepID=UPI002B7AC0AA|nr:hypothetical protein [Pseudorhodoplanes sp.]HWV52492.1 hypothetical protein [Pseudorhodoplanes sp.]
MKNHVVALAEAVRLARQELEDLAEHKAASKERALKRLTALLDNEDVKEALAALSPVDDAPSMKSDPPVDLRVPYPWRSH